MCFRITGTNDKIQRLPSRELMHACHTYKSCKSCLKNRQEFAKGKIKASVQSHRNTYQSDRPVQLIQNMRDSRLILSISLCNAVNNHGFTPMALPCSGVARPTLSETFIYGLTPVELRRNIKSNLNLFNLTFLDRYHFALRLTV